MPKPDVATQQLSVRTTNPVQRPTARRRRDALSLAASWLVTRGILVSMLASVEHGVTSDLRYYYQQLSQVGTDRLARTLVEYPTPVAWLLGLPQVVGIRSPGTYVVAFAASMVVLDVVLTVCLWRSTHRREEIVGGYFWIGYVFALGPICYARFDMLPAVIVGLALLVMKRLPWLTGVLLGVGAALKLWPAVLAGVFAVRRHNRWLMLIAFAGTGLGLALLSLATGGFGRLISPLRWVSSRGLQVESIWASPLLAARAINPARWQVAPTPFHAKEVFGPGVTIMLGASAAATVAGFVVITLLLIRGYLRTTVGPATISLMVLTTVMLIIATSKVLSPQYLLWLGGPAACLLMTSRPVDATRPHPRARLGVQLLLLALLTHLIYPELYGALLGRHGHTMLMAATAVVVARNLLLVGLTVTVCWRTWSALDMHTAPPA